MFVLTVLSVTCGVSNCISVRIGKGTQLLFTAIKFFGIAVIVIGGFVMLSKGEYVSYGRSSLLFCVSGY